MGGLYSRIRIGKYRKNNGPLKFCFDVAKSFITDKLHYDNNCNGVCGIIDDPTPAPTT